MKQWTRVRQRVLRDKQSKRSVMREEGLHWETLEKMLAHSRPPGYRRKKRRGRKIDGYVGWIEEVLKADRKYLSMSICFLSSFMSLIFTLFRRL